jgi:hypothetical protein
MANGKHPALKFSDDEKSQRVKDRTDYTFCTIFTANRRYQRQTRQFSNPLNTTHLIQVRNTAVARRWEGTGLRKLELRTVNKHTREIKYYFKN